MKKILLFLTLFTGMTLTGCNDSFLEKYPVTSLTEEKFQPLPEVAFVTV